MGQDFTYGLLTSVDGEKDPRNLVLIFSLFPIVVKNINLGPFTEEMFEVVAAYFPIDFVPVSKIIKFYKVYLLVSLLFFCFNIISNNQNKFLQLFQHAFSA